MMLKIQLWSQQSNTCYNIFAQKSVIALLFLIVFWIRWTQYQEYFVSVICQIAIFSTLQSSRRRKCTTDWFVTHHKSERRTMWWTQLVSRLWLTGLVYHLGWVNIYNNHFSDASRSRFLNLKIDLCVFRLCVNKT